VKRVNEKARQQVPHAYFCGVYHSPILAEIL